MLSAWQNFREGIKSEETKFDYTRKVKFFLEFAYDVSKTDGSKLIFGSVEGS